MPNIFNQSDWDVWLHSAEKTVKAGATEVITDAEAAAANLESGILKLVDEVEKKVKTAASGAATRTEVKRGAKTVETTGKPDMETR